MVRIYVHSHLCSELCMAFGSVIAVCLLDAELYAPNIRSLIIFILASSIAATALFFKFYTGPRMAWYATQLCSIGLVAVGNKVFTPVKRSVGHILKSAIAFLVLFNLTFAVVEQNKLYNESEEIVRLFLDSPNGDVFYDNIPRHISPSLYKTSIRYFNMESLGIFSHYWRENDDVMLTLLPTRLKNFEPASAMPCRSDSTLFIKDGLLVARESAVAGKDRFWIETTERRAGLKPQYIVSFFLPPTTQDGLSLIHTSHRWAVST